MGLFTSETKAPPSVTLAAATAVIEAAKKKADALGVPMNVAVADEGANLVAFARMDGAWLGSIEIATKRPTPPAP